MIEELRAKKEAEKKAKNPNRVGGWYVELKRQREARGEPGMWNEHPSLLIFHCVVVVPPTDISTTCGVQQTTNGCPLSAVCGTKALEVCMRASIGPTMLATAVLLEQQHGHPSRITTATVLEGLATNTDAR